MFSGYRDISMVGEGGLGRVYRAVRDSTGGVVAIKELSDVETSSPVWHRARRELEALLRLKGHSYVISVEEIIEGPIGPCLVMEFASGGSLMDRMTKGPMTIPEVVLIGQHVSQALVAAHRVGIVHRDVKPHNLLIGRFGQVKVSDFGIAAIVRGSEGYTQTKSLTLDYASPEELDGDDLVGPAADVYSFAATIVHLITGKRPRFSNRSVLASSTVAVASDDEPPMRSVLVLLRQSFAESPDDRPTMPDLSAAFESAANALGDRRLLQLPDVLPADDSSPAAATVQRDLGTPRRSFRFEDDAETVLRRSLHEESPTRLHERDGSEMGQPALTALSSGLREVGRLRQFTPLAIATIGIVLAGAALIVAKTSGKSSNSTAPTTALIVSTSPQSSPPVTEASSSPVDEVEPTEVVAPPSSFASATTELTDTATSVQVDTTVAPIASLTLPTPSSAALYSPDGSRIATWTDGSDVSVWDASNGASTVVLPTKSVASPYVLFSPDGQQILVIDQNLQATVWNASSGRKLFSLPYSNEQHTDVAIFSPDGTRIATADGVNSAYIWDAYSGDKLETLQGHGVSVAGLAFSPDGGVLVTASFDGTSVIWNSLSGDRIATSSIDEGVVTSVDFSPDGSSYVTTGDADWASVWNAATGVLRFKLPGGEFVALADFNHDGTQIVTTSGDGPIDIWDGLDGSRLLTLSGHTDQVLSAYFSPDGTRVLSSSVDGTTRVWSAVTGVELARFETISRTNTFSPDGAAVAIPGDSGTTVWSL